MTIAHVPTRYASVNRERTAVEVTLPAVTSLRSALTAEQHLSRAFLKGTIVGTVLVFLFCGGISLLSGLALGPAIGIGAFTAFWGGPGFGGMMGATIYFSYHQEDF
jgi:hypothetical protein